MDNLSDRIGEAPISKTPDKSNNRSALRSRRNGRPRGDTVVPLRPTSEQTEKDLSQKSTLEKLLNAHADMVIICDKEMKRVIACNDKVEKESGLNAEALNHRTLSSFFGQSTLQRVNNSETIINNQEMECASGLKLPVNLKLDSIDWNDEEALMITIKNLQADKEIKQVVASVTHDLNNVFSVLYGNATLLRAELGVESGSDDLSGINAVISATQRGMALLGQLQQLTTTQLLRRQNTTIFPLIDDIVSSLDYWEGKYGVSFEVNCANDYECNIDTSKITEAVFNLIKNSKDAMPYGGKIRITIQNRPFDNYTQPAVSKSSKGIYLCIEDEGEGIDTDHKNKIFSPAFSTKRAYGKGYGFGLANVLRVVKAHEGSISVESKTGEGSFTRFIIFLPE